jgi:hypothetical protein
MSPLPPRHKLFFGLLAMLALCFAWWLGFYLFNKTGAEKENEKKKERETSAPVLSATDVVRATSTTNPVISPSNYPALARAIALAGQLADGHHVSLDNYSADTLALLDYARQLLAQIPRKSAPGLPLALPGGGQLRMPPDVKDEHNNTPIHSPTTEPELKDTTARVVDGALVPRQLDASGRIPLPVTGDIKKEIIAPDAWIAIPYDPTTVAGKPLEITNRTPGFTPSV